MSRYRIALPLFRDPRTIALFATLSGCSAYFTYRGASMVILTGTSDWMDHTGALIFAIASSTAIFMLWTAAPRAFERLETLPELLAGMAVTLAACAMVFSLSSWLNVAGIAGQSALVFHMTERIAAYEDVLEKRHAAGAAIKSFSPSLKQANAAFVSRSESELRNGAYTGAPGEGTVEQLLATVAERYLKLESAVTEELSRMDTIAQQSRQVLVEMRTAANSPGSPADRMEKLARSADRLRGLLGELSPGGFVDSLRRELLAIPREVTLYTISGKSEKARTAQAEALKRIETELAETANQFNADFERIGREALPDIPTMSRLNVIEAVLRYPLQNAPYWAGGIAMDFTPTLLLLFAVLMKIARGRPGQFVDAVNDLSVRDLKTAQHAIETLREGRISQDSINRLHDELTGDFLLEDRSNDKQV